MAIRSDHGGSLIPSGLRHGFRKTRRSHPRLEIDSATSSDHYGHMIRTLKESKATLSALVERASRGEEVVITVRGVPKARLCPITDSPSGNSQERHGWGQRLGEIRAEYSVGTHDSSSEILGRQREDRV